MAEAFHDTNVILYLFSGDARKADTAETLLRDGGRVSVQVLNELASVASRKLRLRWGEVRELLETVRALCKVDPVTIAVHERALEIAQRHRLGLYDACIVAAALIGRCEVLHSEDLQHGQVFDGSLRVVNPFR